ncbi:MAG: class I SAM-dependent methyltransferase, partial [Thermodesulfobacteriota bacterium]
LQNNYPASSVFSSKEEQLNYKESDGNRHYKYIPCPLCSEDKYIIFHKKTDFAPRERKYNKDKWKDFILILSTKIIGVRNTSSLLSLYLGEKINLEELGYTVVQCTNCGFFYRNPIYRDDTIVKAYNRGYLKFLSGQYSEDRIKTYDWVLNQLEFERKLGPVSGKRILDVGCGFGLFLQHFQKKGLEPYGVDFAEDCIQYAQDELDLKNTRVGNLDENSYENNYFDAVTLWSVAAHLNDPITMFRNIFRVLKKDGFLIIFTVNAGGIQHMVELEYWNGFSKNHLIFFSTDTIERALNKVGFNHVEFGYDDRHFKKLLKENKILKEERDTVNKLMEEKVLGDMLLVLARK